MFKYLDKDQLCKLYAGELHSSKHHSTHAINESVCGWHTALEMNFKLELKFVNS